MKVSIRQILVLCSVTLSLQLAAAPAPPVGGGNPGCWPPPCIPIDGGISLLVAAGALYGLKRLKSPSAESAD